MEPARAEQRGAATAAFAEQPAPAVVAGIAEVAVQPGGGIAPAQWQHEGAVLRSE